MIIPKPHFLQSIDLYLPLTLNYWVLVTGSEAQYLYFQFPLIIGFLEQTTDLPLMLPPPPKSLPSVLLRLGNRLKDPLGVANEPCFNHKCKKKPVATEVNHSLNSASHLFFFVLCFTLLYFRVLIRLKRYSYHIQDIKKYTVFQNGNQESRWGLGEKCYLKIFWHFGNPNKSRLFISVTLVRGLKWNASDLKRGMYNFQVIHHKLHFQNWNEYLTKFNLKSHCHSHKHQNVAWDFFLFLLIKL